MHGRGVHVPEPSTGLAAYSTILVVRDFLFPSMLVFPAESEPKAALLCLLRQDCGCAPQLGSGDSKGCQEPLGGDSHEASAPSSQGTVSFTMTTVLMGLDQRTMSGRRVVGVITWGKLSCWSRSAVTFHSPPGERRDHCFFLQL